MTQPKRICAIGAIVFLILLLTALAAYALVSPSVSSLAPVATRDQGLSQAWFFGQDTGAPHSPAMICALVIDAQIAQNEIPNVLVPSTIPSAEPSLPAASPTPQPPTVSTNSTNGTTRSLVLFLFHERSRSRGSERRKRSKRSIHRRGRRYRVERTQVSLGLVPSRLLQTDTATTLITLPTVRFLRTTIGDRPPKGGRITAKKPLRRPINGISASKQTIDKTLYNVRINR